jgi:pimeloyl-ACP methyl ester carboxylesterase
MRWIAIASTMMAALLSTSGATAARHELPAHSAACYAANVPVRDIPAESVLASISVHGILCEPENGHPKAVMVLVPGATYNHIYWDFPYVPATYNFRAVMNSAGYATFTIDRLSTGASSRPPSELLTSTAQAAAVNSVIAALRIGTIGRMKFSTVILGGHSGGSAISLIEAGTYHNVSGVLLTGWSHTLDLPRLATVFATLYPAFLDPAFAGKGYDPAYLTTRPGTRKTDFYAQGTTDPAVVALDEKTKDVESTTEVGDAFGISSASPYSDRIEAPVLLVNGEYDNLVCGPLLEKCANATALKASEAPYYARSPCLSTYVLPGAAHDVNLATDTPEYQREVLKWANNLTGTESAKAKSTCTN